MRRRPQQARSRASVDAILTAAERLLVAHGAGAVTTNHIAERAGVSVGTLYQYFADKDAVFDAVAERFVGSLVGITAVPEGTPPDDLTSRLRVLIDGTVQVMSSKPGLMQALDATRSGTYTGLLQSLRDSVQSELATWIRAASDQLSVANPDETARYVVVLAEGVGRSLPANADVAHEASRLEHHIHRLLGLRPSPPRSTPIARLPTPCLLLDAHRLQRNLDRMATRARTLGVRLRPHIKTAKSVAIARRAVGPGGPLTVSTLREAEYFAARGFTDLVYAVALAPDRLDRVWALTRAGVRVVLFVESLEVARALAAHPGHFEALVELDCGENRTGVQSDADLLAIAEVLHTAPRCALRGVATHGGHSYSAETTAARAAVAEEERSTAVRAATVLRQAGLPCAEVSVGSTPTAVHATHLNGVTELRPGVYTLGDLFQAGVGSHTLDDIACTVLSTVLSHRRRSNTVVIDAGGLALSKDRSTAGWPFDAGYGLLAAADTGDVLPGLRVVAVHQEHGLVESDGPMCWERLPVGGRVRVLPNHICMTAAMYDRYHVAQDARLVDVWGRVNGW